MAASSLNLVKPSPVSTFPFQLKSKGCCPDDFTTARGTNKEGCGCYSTPNGCCPDKFTPSPGPDGKVKDENGKLDLHNIPQGCPCNTHEFGCCPNGVSIARGPGQEGCTCKVTFSHFLPQRNLRTPNLAAVTTEEPQLKALMTWGVAVPPVSTDAVLMVNKMSC